MLSHGEFEDRIGSIYNNSLKHEVALLCSAVRGWPLLCPFVYRLHLLELGLVCVCPMEMMLCRKGASHHINQHFEQAVLLSSSQCYHVNSKKTCGSSEGLIWGTLCG